MVINLDSGRVGFFGHGQVEFVLEFPDKGTEFPGNGDDSFVFAFAPCFEFHVAFMESILHPPG